jgi:hypothetical protein
MCSRSSRVSMQTLFRSLKVPQTLPTHRIIEFAAKHRLPAIYGSREYVVASGLISYGPDVANVFRRTAGYVDRILRGAKPADFARSHADGNPFSWANRSGVVPKNNHEAVRGSEEDRICGHRLKLAAHGLHAAAAISASSRGWPTGPYWAWTPCRRVPASGQSRRHVAGKCPDVAIPAASEPAGAKTGRALMTAFANTRISPTVGFADEVSGSVSRLSSVYSLRWTAFAQGFQSTSWIPASRKWNNGH